MKTLVLNLSGPLQSWGVGSRFSRRSTQTEPSKSGVLGLLAAAQGRPREASLDDLAALSLAVRVDMPGELVEDFHTARAPHSQSSNLSWRHYRSDAAYVAAVTGNDELVVGLSDALREPKFPLYMGRRSCPAPLNLVGGIVDKGDAEEVLRDLSTAPWQASEQYRKNAPTEVRLPIARDARPGEIGESVYDVPVSFDPRHRKYDARIVVRPEPVLVRNDVGVKYADPFFQTVQEA